MDEFSRKIRYGRADQYCGITFKFAEGEFPDKDLYNLKETMKNSNQKLFNGINIHVIVSTWYGLNRILECFNGFHSLLCHEQHLKLERDKGIEVQI